MPIKDQIKNFVKKKTEKRLPAGKLAQCVSSSKPLAIQASPGAEADKKQAEEDEK